MIEHCIAGNRMYVSICKMNDEMKCTERGRMVMDAFNQISMSKGLCSIKAHKLKFISFFFIFLNSFFSIKSEILYDR